MAPGTQGYKSGEILNLNDVSGSVPAQTKWRLTPTGSSAFTTATYFYTARNEIDYETDPADAAHVIDYEYDNEGRQTLRYDRYNGITGAIERTTQQIFNADGTLAERKATGPGLEEHRTVFGYDADRNTTLVSTFKAGSVAPNVSAITATYVSSGELKDWSETLYPPTGTAVTKAGAYGWGPDGLQDSNIVDGQTSNSKWFRDGNEEKFTPYGGFGSFDSTYFDNGALKQSIFPIDPANPTKSTTLKQRYDLADRATSRIFTSTTGAKISAWEAITYDENSNRLSETVNQAQPSGATPANRSGGATYGYDNLDRLTSFKHPFETANTVYTLDDAGNVTNESTTPATSFSFTNNRLTGRVNGVNNFTYAYDHFGNQTAENKLLTNPRSTTYNAGSYTKRETLPDGTWVEYNYDGLGRMVSRQDAAGTVLMFHQGMDDQIAVEHSMVTGLVTARYLIDGYGMPRGKLSIANSTGRSYYVTDPRGNVTQQVSYTTHTIMAVFAYDPYGKDKTALTKRTGNWDSRLRFQLAPKDTLTGSYSIGPRLMNPTINRFVGADMYVSAAANIGLQMDPLTGNRYLYAGANPAGLIDDGHGYVICRSAMFLICATATKEKEKEAVSRRGGNRPPPIPLFPGRSQRQPVLVDTSVLIEAQKGNVAAGQLLASQKLGILLTPGVVHEFVNGSSSRANRAQNIAFLSAISYRLYSNQTAEGTADYLEIRRRGYASGQSGIDVQLIGYAHVSGITLATANSKMVRFIEGTLPKRLRPPYAEVPS